MIHAKERNRFERIVARYPHLSVFLASAAGATIGVSVWKRYGQPTFSNTETKEKINFSTNANFKYAALAGAIVGTSIAAVADGAMPRFAPQSNSSVILAK